MDQQNYRLIPEFIKKGEDLGVDHISLYNFQPSPYDGFRVQERTLLAHDQEVVEFLKTVVPERLRGKVSLPTLLDLEQKEKKCRIHTTMLRVDADKNYSGCSIMLLNMEGDKKITDHEVWNSEFFQEMRGRFISPNKDDLYDPCKVCTRNYGVEPCGINMDSEG
ncbi:moaA/nifB/ppqE/nirJ protein family for cofactor bionsynthesis [Candidatus Thiomargarita nelsonii]|uniref:MoaA/nifB/ppqE/nirJ protein family for cofactor bionsynthesis n=1 Tax=Candidatus Thiomargarita nelsonii TaxID=1003181 RepID=A0A176S2X7_9GAMM|nr:moaA/nifB/ppqE/nirJ protein family for cofactor bionsynthesis [Candidatus Thiomargarita nelsonii]